MSRAVRITGFIAGGVLLLAGVGYGTAYTVSQGKLTETFEMELTTVAIPEDEAAIARGDRLVNSVAGCVDCHGANLAGTVMSDDAMALLAAPNLTSGRGGIGAEFTDQDWIRAIRHGVRRDGTSLLIMPSYAYASLTDADLGAMIAYLKQLPAIDHELPSFRLRPLGRALVAAGAFDEEFVAKKVVPRGAEFEAVEEGVTVEYGSYLATVSGCTSCHRPDLKGGPAGPPDAPPASDISPTALASWTEEDFFASMRDGRRPDGTEISDFMPWRALGTMEDDELSAIWLYLRSVPAE